MIMLTKSLSSVLATIMFAGICAAADFSVQLPESPRAWEITAGKELQDYCQRALKSALLIDGKEIKNVVLMRDDKLPEESWFYFSKDDTLTIGGSGRGLLYGVYCFLENELGIRWYSEDVEVVPEYTAALQLPALDKKGKPVMIYRDIYRNNLKNDQGRFAARNRLNRRGDEPIAAQYGGTCNYGKPYHCHTFSFYVPEKKYIKTNPEYFALVRGKRVGGLSTGQLCLSNPELPGIILPQLRQYILDDREAAKKSGRAPYVLYDISINDSTNYCQCEKCNKQAAEIGHSGIIINFVNAIAREIGKEFPEVKITTLAYWYCEDIPKNNIRPASNVVVKLCDTVTNQASPITAPENEVYLKRLQEWGKISENLFIWDYGIAYDGSVYPFPSEFDQGILAREYVKNKVSGVFWEHEYPESSDMHELKVWIEAKMMENPEQDVENLIRDFCNGFYGAAGEHIFAARKALYNARKKNNGRVPWYALAADFKFIDGDCAAEMMAHFDAAQQAVGNDPELSARIRRARLGLDLLVAGRLIEMQKAFAVDVDALKARLEIAASGKDQPKACYKNSQKSIRAAKSKLIFLANVTALPENAEYTQDGCFDLPLVSMINLDPATVSISADPMAACKVAIKIDAAKKPKTYGMPFNAGIHNTINNQTIRDLTVKSVPADGQYHWYSIPATKIHSGCYLYLTRSWRIRGRMIPGGEEARKMVVKLHMRFTGKLFGENTPDDAGTIWIDRITLVPAK